MTLSGMKGGVWLLSFLLVGFTTGQISPVTNPVNTSSCGQNVGCLHYPVDCATPNCLALLTWTLSPDNNSIDFGLMAAADGWVAVGLSDDTLMGSDSVTHCIVNSSNNNVISVGFSFNSGYNNMPGPDSGQYLRNISASYVNNEINCRFSRSIMGDNDRIYTLNYYWYLLLGFGHAIGGVKQKHQYDPQVSSIRVNVLRDFLDVSKPVTAPTRPPTAPPPPCSNCFSDGSGSQVTFSNSSTDNTVLINMTSTAVMVSSGGWLGLGFSYDNIMANDSVIDCILMPNGSVIVKNSYNQPHYNTEIPLPTALQGITVVNASYTNGLLQCVLRRQINGLSDPSIFNLTASFYLLLARGPINGQGIKQYHSQRHVSPAPVNVVNGFTFSDSLTPTTVSPQSQNSTCSFSDSSNKYSVNYQLSADGTSVNFLIQGPVSPSSWISVGFSYDSGMGNDSVLDCIVKSDSTVIVQNSYNRPLPERNNVPVTNSSDGITVYDANFTNGTLSCYFSRRISGFQDPQIYPLTKSYYLLIATGPLNSDGSKNYHTIRNPSTQPRDFISTTCPNLVLNQTPTSLTPTTVSPQSQNSTCSFSDSTNKYSVNYQLSADSTSFNFLIQGSVGLSSWISVGFSNDKSMGEDSVLDCILKPDSSVVVQNSYNVPARYNVPVTNSSDGITVYMTNFTEGRLSCNFSRRISGFQDPQIFPLTKSYYLLIASGPLNGDGTKAKHTVPGEPSPQPVDFTAAKCQNVQGTSRKYSNAPDPVRLLRAHGVLMITAFVMIMSSSIIIARYYRTCWPEDTICKTAVWFAVHRFLMILSLCLCAAGFIIIFCYSDGWLFREYPIGTPSYFWAHGPIGISVMILIIMNPIISAFRCKPDHDYRAIFNWLHWTVGTCCHILGGINLFFGIKMGEVYYGISHTAVFWILIAFVGFHVFTEILLSIEKIITERQTQNSFTINYAMSEPGHEPRAHKEQVHVATRGSLLFRYFFLALYTLVTMGLWLAMIILIGGGFVNRT